MSPSTRAERVANVVRWCLVIAMAATAFWSWTRLDATNAVQAGRYLCPMHPEIHTDAPGECPICHMALVPAGSSTNMDAPFPDPVSDAGTVPAPLHVSLARAQAAGIALAAVTSRRLATTLRTQGVVEPDEGAIAEVHARASGFVERVAIARTSVPVSAGQVLAWIYAPEIFQAEQEYLAARAWQGPESSHPSSHATPSPDGATAAPDRVASAARVRLGLLGLRDDDIARMESTRTPLRAVPLRATRSGVVVRRAAVLGAYVTPETTLYEIQDLGAVRAVASVPESWIGRLREGVSAAVRAPGSETVARVHVGRMEPVLDPETRSVRLRIPLPRAAAWMPGRTVDIALDVGSREGPAVPVDAVVQSQGRAVVFVRLADGRFEAREVRTGLTLDGWTEVLSGLATGESVVARGGYLLDAESRLGAAMEPLAESAGAR